MLTLEDIKPDHFLSVKIAVYFARDVLHIFESEYPEDLRPRLAIEVAEKYLDNYAATGYATGYAYDAAYNAARSAYVVFNISYAAANAAHAAAYAAYATTRPVSDGAIYAANDAANAVEKNRDNYIHQKLLELLPVIFHHKMEHREPFGNIENIWKYLTLEQQEEAVFCLDVLK